MNAGDVMVVYVVWDGEWEGVAHREALRYKWRGWGSRGERVAR